MAPLVPPIRPMLARAVGDAVPQRAPGGGELLYEPKWDGFRCVLFRDARDGLPGTGTVVLQSRSGEDLSYAFPEIVEAAELLPDRVVLDGELVVADAGRLWFERLQMRLRPRSEAGGWKIAELRRAHPVSFVGFDVLALDGRDLRGEPMRERRMALEELDLAPPLHATPVTRDHAEAQRWFRQFEGAGLDGLVAKPADGQYQPGKRAMFKVKHVRTVDAVVGGWRPHKLPGPDGRPVVGSLLLGLYDNDDAAAPTLHSVGVASSFSAARRAELATELAPYAATDQDPHPWRHWAAETAGQRTPGGQSRWSAGKDLSFRLLRPELVAEVKYDHMEGRRFRHVTRLLRWRPDRTPESCTFDQLDRPVRFHLTGIVPGLGSPGPDPSGGAD